MIKKMLVLTGKVLIIFLVGILGGIWGEHYLLPRIISYSPFNQIKWLNDFRFGTTIINQTKKEFVIQDQAISEIVNNVSPSIVGIRTIIHKNNQIIIHTEGSGIILTNDGVILTTTNLFPPGNKQLRVEAFVDNKWIPANISYNASSSNIIFIKIEKNNLPITNWNATANNIIIGKKCILIGFNHKNKKKIIDLGFIKSYPPIELSFIAEPGFMTGGTVFDLSGKALGIINIQSNDSVKFISAKKLLSLTDKYENRKK
ncbi:MAG TPA: serine protease [Candidatus Portnoybacteria bacterium]|nr:serine protease [Candidatus Portnoybacteria bacterium]